MRRFYGQTLGLPGPEAEIGEDDEAFSLTGKAMIHAYESPSRSAATGHTIATSLVENLDDEMADLRGREVDIVEYDTPDIRTENGIFSRGDGFKAAWITDPDSNILSIERLATAR